MPRAWKSLPSPAPSSPPSSSAWVQQRCALTNHSSGLTVAHIIPKEEVEWFSRNDMGRYANDDLEGLGGSQNLVPLRADIHVCFDSRHFTMVPKPSDAAGAGDWAYVAHSLSNDEFTALYHNIPLLYLEGISPEYLFARFAWSILIRIKRFIVAGPSRQVIQSINFEYRARLLDGPELVRSYRPGGSRTASRKRRRPAQIMTGDGAADDLDELPGEEYDTIDDLEVLD
jgi:hypothetical protein